ncbi:MAG TPA: DUF222 domain-containing protein [Mycobacterium sp.]|nr:DUF222 domain-containing protein [Mycobacterium sp.]
MALAAPRWPSMTAGRLGTAIDRIVAKADPDAVRRAREAAADRQVSIWDAGDGLAGCSALLMATDAAVLDQRLDALAAGVCAADPRTAAQRRADALGVLGAGADRLGCRCGRTDCPAGGPRSTPAVVVHVLAEPAALTGGDPTAAGYLLDTGAAIPAPVLAELGDTATRQPLSHPRDAAPEPGYVPSTALADYVRARDLTCEAIRQSRLGVGGRSADVRRRIYTRRGTVRVLRGRTR